MKIRCHLTFYGYYVSKWRRQVLWCALLLASSKMEAQKTNILFLLDASFSMKKDWDNGTKWDVAQRTMAQIADSIALIDNVQVGLRIFGHMYDEPDHNCKDTRLELPIAKYSGDRLLAKLKSVKPKGITPIALALEKAAGDFANLTGERNILILITDGEEACEGDMCSASFLLQQQGIILKPYVIGLQLNKKAAGTFSCVGEMVNATSSLQFEKELKRLVAESIAKTTLQINLLDHTAQPTETGMALTFYDAATHLPKHHFFHTLNARGLPDTITISPLFTYDILVHTVPPIEIKNVVVQKNKHQTITADAAQGSLQIIWKGTPPSPAQTNTMQAIIHRQGETKILAVQNINGAANSLLAGTYSLEILTTPRINLPAINIAPHQTTTIEVPAPGLVQVQKNSALIGAVLLEKKDGLEKVLDLNPDAKPEQWLLQPGTYRVVVRAKDARSMHSSVEKQIEVVSGGNISLKL